VISVFSSIKDDLIQIISGVVYIALITYMLIRECYKITRQKCGYFKNTSFLINWPLFGFSYTALAVYFYRFYACIELKSFFDKTRGTGYINMQSMNTWDQIYIAMLALCTCLASVKLIKLLRFNSSIMLILTALRRSMRNIIGLALIFCVLFFSFVQLFYVVCNEKSIGFSTVVRTMVTLFLYCLQKISDADQVIEGNVFLGPFMFISFNVLLGLILLNLFFTLICDSFLAVRTEKQNYMAENDIGVFLSEQLKSFIRRIRRENPKEIGNAAKTSSAEFVSETHQLLSSRINKIFGNLELV
jgi:hypothetical protein